jgi:hypothetical protein
MRKGGLRGPYSLRVGSNRVLYQLTDGGPNPSIRTQSLGIIGFISAATSQDLVRLRYRRICNSGEKGRTWLRTSRSRCESISPRSVRGPLADKSRRKPGPEMAKLRFRNAGEDGGPPDVPDGAVLGRMVGGERALPVQGGQVIWPFEQLRRHAVVFGDPGSGKTETTMRIAHELALKADASVVFLDARGDARGAERFAAVMEGVGRRVRRFPEEHFDAWRAQPVALETWLIALAGPWPGREGEAPWLEEDVATIMLRAACRDAGDPPRSSAELMARLDDESLLASRGDALGAIRREVVDRVVWRLRGLFEELDGRLDGEWSWEDADAAYIRVENAKDYPGSPNLARFFLDDWAHYLHRRPPGRRDLMLVDGMTDQLVTGEELQQVLGEAGMYEAGVVISWDSPEDIGSERQREIFLGALWTVIVHATSSPADICALAGSRQGSELKTVRTYGDGEWRQEHEIHQRERPNLTPGDLLASPPGTAWIIEKGKAIKVAVTAVEPGLSTP